MTKKQEIRETDIRVLGARVHNLKNIDVVIPHNQLTVITGLSGSGKSSLAFDTIHAEGQRRYIETFSAYARQFLGNMERPDVEKISGLSPVISIEQKSANKNPRSTVGTITEVYDFLRLLFARASTAYSMNTGEKMVRYTNEQIVEILVSKYQGKKVHILSPLIKGRKGHYKELFEQIRNRGFIYARIDDEIKELKYGLKLDRYKVHNIEIVIDKLIPEAGDTERLRKTVDTAMRHGKGMLAVLDIENNEMKHFSKTLMCPTTGISYNEPAPHSFSFNSPHGACHKCNGLGRISEVDITKIIPDQKESIRQGGIVPLGKYKNTLIFWQIEAIARKYDFTLNTPIQDIPEEALNTILYGSGDTFRLENTPLGNTSNYYLSFEGIINYITKQKEEENSKNIQKWADQFVVKIDCPECDGSRLRKESLFFKIAEKNIHELATMDLSELKVWFDSFEDKLESREKLIAAEIAKEIRNRLSFLIDVGLDYISLHRSAGSLSGGELQRIRLATQIGSKLVNVLYILDEPSIGLHQRDNLRLINSLKALRDTGNTVIVVEHDKETIMSADFVLDIGPFAGNQGGYVVGSGSPEEICKQQTLTADYLNGIKKIEIPEVRRKGNGNEITIKGASGNNLKKIDVNIPLGMMICVTGVSGSGKSTLINETLHPFLAKKFYGAHKHPLDHISISGDEHIDKVIEVNQSPLGRTPRSNPATYTGLFTEIRKVFESLPESKIRGYKAGRYSFNVKGGRCEGCSGAGVKTIEMNFLPDVYVPCDECFGKRYNRETLEVRFKGKSINDILEMKISEARSFFKSIPAIHLKLKTLEEVGLGYISLGQPSTTLSGGESQRVKLAAELAKKDTGKTMYILDEPTTGLHFEDIRILLKVLNRLVDKGNTVLIIEHNLDVIKIADHIIDLGPEGGKRGGRILVEGTPEFVADSKIGFTSEFLRSELAQGS